MSYIYTYIYNSEIELIDFSFSVSLKIITLLPGNFRSIVKTANLFSFSRDFTCRKATTTKTVANGGKESLWFNTKNRKSYM